MNKLESKLREMQTLNVREESQDAYFVMKDLKLRGVESGGGADLSKYYIRALVDDDTFCTQFGKLSEPQCLQWSDTIYLPLK